MSTFKIDAELRDDLGKGASRRLRHDNKVPAIIYGSGKDPRTISLNHLKVLRYIENESFFTSIIELKAAGGKRQKVILRDMQRHPSKPVILHMDFQRIADDVELTMNIPLHFLNEEDCPAAKLGGVIVSHQMTDVEINCLPADLPEYIEVDLDGFDDGDFIRLSDIKLPKGVVLTAFTHGDVEEHDAVVVTTTHVQAEVEVEADVEETAAPTAAEVPTAQDEKEENKE
ncbi:MAG: 50S ribosomal protein L25/general stress protein Ctc [Proteobacteria bacterium]|nr:50S ribosomal protein L25/general stress protein Ctc [Pseudomonadota bacterium]